MRYRDEKSRRFRTAAGRDLWWALTSPSMMRHPVVVTGEWGVRELEVFHGTFAMLDKRESPLEKAVRRHRSTRLGAYFEVLVGTWIKEVPPARYLASNWQVFGGQGTIGEFDLIFERDGEIWHWELAVKFYLGYPDRFGAKWYGPNPKDRLGVKWARMKEKQLRLGKNGAGQAALRKLNVFEAVRPRAFIKGYFFEALNPAYQVELPKEANEEALRGFWCHRGEWMEHRERLEKEGALRWAPLGKERWMAPVEAEEEVAHQRYEAMGIGLREDQATMVVGMREGEEGLEEVCRGFVVPDGWPKG